MRHRDHLLNRLDDREVQKYVESARKQVKLISERLLEKYSNNDLHQQPGIID